ncbi:MAG: ABC transporter ATP-binding protein [Lachnospiraceae bacterium]|nr:ABC transporter ATP-binding protein [Lachnospiraceae bacterium]
MKIAVKDLTKRFPNRNKKIREEVVAVDHFTFEIPDGELVSLLGPSGCGKSTTLNMICGLETPTEGQIFFGETDVTKLPPEKRGVGMVFQSYALYPHLTVLENIRFPLENRKGADKLSKEEMNRRAREAAALVQIDGLLERKPGELSGGQQQRVAIARALVKTPGVLLLDEPLSNLDARLRLQTRMEIRRIQQETGITTVFVTHDQEEAMSISDRMVVMKDGVLQQIGKPQEIYDRPVNLFVAKFLGTPPINVMEGELRQGSLYIGGDCVFTWTDEEAKALPGTTEYGDGIADARNESLAGAPRKVIVGIRPEGLIPDPEGTFVCEQRAVETLGRDTSVIFRHAGALTDTMRAIVDSADLTERADGRVRFRLRPGRFHLFDPETEVRL